MRLDFSLSSGYFYREILPVLEANEVLIFTGKWYKKRMLGRYGKVYRFDKVKFYHFLSNSNEIFFKIFKDLKDEYIIYL